jgi:hypothetical protein
MEPFAKVSLDEVRVRTTRRGKTGELREQILLMSLGDAMYVPYYDAVTGIGYKRPTVAQLASMLTKHGEFRYSVCRDKTSHGCYVVCKDKSEEGAKRGPKPKAN